MMLIEDDSAGWVQVEVIDKGPGIDNLDLAMADNYSSSGTLGLGLPGVRRLVDHFDIRSTPGEGTRVCVRMNCRNRRTA
jgi:serine/threonine-protein kinase RsbT